jgi:hypothetical protein
MELMLVSVCVDVNARRHERILGLPGSAAQTTFSARSIDFFCIEPGRFRLRESQSKPPKKSFEARGARVLAWDPIVANLDFTETFQ